MEDREAKKDRHALYRAIYLDTVEQERLIGACWALFVVGTKRFGPPTAVIKEMVADDASITRLKRLLERILVAESWEDLLRDEADTPKTNSPLGKRIDREDYG